MKGVLNITLGKPSALILQNFSNYFLLHAAQILHFFICLLNVHIIKRHDKPIECFVLRHLTPDVPGISVRSHWACIIIFWLIRPSAKSTARTMRPSVSLTGTGNHSCISRYHISPRHRPSMVPTGMSHAQLKRMAPNSISPAAFTVRFYRFASSQLFGFLGICHVISILSPTLCVKTPEIGPAYSL